MTMTDAEKYAQKQKKLWVIASILLVIFAISFTKNVLFRKKASSAPVASAEVDLAQSLSEDLLFVTSLRTKDRQFADQTAVWEKEWGRDPFIAQAVISTVVKAVNLTLNGILWDDVKPKAIVNEKTLITGDTIYGYTVVQIKPKSIVLKTGEKNIELSVFHPVGDPTS